MDVRIEPSWKQQLQEEFDKPYFEKLVTFVKDEYKRAHVLPLGHQIFHIFNSCPFEKVQSPNQKIPDRKTKCVIKTHINIKQNVIFGAKLKPV